MTTDTLVEDNQQLAELDHQHTSARAELIQTKSLLTMKQKAKRRAELCKTEIEQLPEETKSYKAVGRMFLASPLPSIKSQLDDLLVKTNSEIITLQQQEKQLTGQVTKLKENIDELVGKEERTKGAV